MTVVEQAERTGQEEVEGQSKQGGSLDFQAMIATMPDAIIALDQHFRVYDMNPAASHALGWSVTDARGQRCTEILRCQNLNHVELCGTPGCPLVRVLQQERPLPYEDLIIGTQSEHICEVSTSDTPFYSNKSSSLSSLSSPPHSFSTPKGDTHETSQEKFVAFVARDVSALKVANQVRSNFVSMVSHELRTPLNSVHGFIDLLLHGHMGPLSNEQAMYLGYTQQGVQQLVSIVEDILFMTRSDLGQFQIRQQEVSLLPLVKQVISSLQPQVGKAEVVLRQEIADGVPTLFVDPKRLIQVLNNLIANAIKFTPPGREIVVKARRSSDDMVLISVVDEGYGIPLEDQQHVFERFYQSNHHQQSKMGGYGLGLSIAQLIVEQHGGTIGLESVVDEGTTFFFTMPIYKKT